MLELKSALKDENSKSANVTYELNLAQLPGPQTRSMIKIEDLVSRLAYLEKYVGITEENQNEVRL